MLRIQYLLPCRMLLVASVLLISAASARTQWKLIAPYAVLMPTSGGAIAYYNGVVWAGANNLVFSTDNGTTWQTANYSGGKINSIRFFDAKHGVIASSLGIYLTSDGGTTWNAVPNFPSTQTTLDAGYGRLASIIYVDLENTGLVISMDGGNSWQMSPVNDVVLALAIDRTGTIYLTGGPFLPPGMRVGQLYSSTDNGTTWRAGAGYFDEDSYSITIDSSNPDLIYLANEDNLWTGDDSSDLFVSSDAGQSWNVNFARLTTYLNGAITNSTHVVYAGTLRDGVLRSVDRGVTWSNIGGPGGLVDSRSLCAIDDNTVYAFDGLGNIWKTINSGGDSLSIPNITATFSATPSVLFAFDTVSCDSVTRSIVFHRTGGPALYVTGWSIIGLDSGSYRVTGIANDSMMVTMRKAGQGSQYAQLVLTLSNGTKQTITLKGFINNQTNALVASTNKLFAADTVQCDSLTRTLSFIPKGCAPPLALGWKIMGKDSLSYTTSTMSDDSLQVTLRGIHPGEQNAALIVSLSDGASDTVQLSGFVSTAPNQLQAVPSVVFANDTVQCDGLTRFVVFERSGCAPPAVTGWSITGVDSQSYRVANASKDSLAIVFHGVNPGPRHAMLILALNDGTNDTVTLSGYSNVEPNALTAIPNPLFLTDTVYCDSVTRVLAFSRTGCLPPKVMTYHIIGEDSTSYRVGAATLDSLPITFLGNQLGNQRALIILSLDNGSTDTVGLAGFSEEGPNELQAVPTTLFSTDTLTCDSVTRSVVLARTGCNPPSVLSWSIVGADSANYRCKNFFGDSMQITLHGNTQGRQQANLIVQLDNGVSDTVALNGFVSIVPSLLSIPTADQQVTVLGDKISVPISIQGLLRPEDVDLVMHYDGSLDYLGSFSPTGTQLDKSGKNPPGRAILHIPGAVSGSVAGYAEFNAFSDSDEDAHVTFDSLDVMTATSPCEYSAPSITRDTIFLPKGCTIPILSQLIHLGHEPVFNICPNPSSGDISITASETLGPTDLTIYDMLGTVRNETELTIRGSERVQLTMPDAGGVYTIVLKSAAGTYTVRAIHQP